MMEDDWGKITKSLLVTKLEATEQALQFPISIHFKHFCIHVLR